MTQKDGDRSIQIERSSTGSTNVSGDGNVVNNFNVSPTDARQSARVLGILAVPLQMPPLPDHFVERPNQQNAVKDKLLDETTKQGTLVVSAIYGLGGIGKSVLASKLAHDSEVQARFSDGILWATLGQNPDILPLLSGWIQALGDYDYKPTAIESASNHLRTLLYDKRALLVVDDVWNPKHLEPFRVGGEGSCVMVTTREARIPEARRYDLDVMDAVQAIELMTQKLSEPLSEQAREQALAFAKRVGYLPLALELAASQIEEGVSWQELFEDFTAEVTRLEGLDWYGCDEEPDDAERRKYSLLACFNLSLKQLSAEQLQQFAWLGVVPEDVSLTQAMAETLWQVTSRQAGSILRTFRNKALVLQGAKQGDERVSYRMHDLMHDLAQRLLVSPVEPEKVGELPGLGLSKAAAHGELLSRYRAKTVEGQWHTLKDDGYIFAHLTWHMEQAGQTDAIGELLCASDGAGRNGWYVACDALGKPAYFSNDVGRACQLALESYKQDPVAAITKLCRYSLIRTSLNSLASNVPGYLVSELIKNNVWQPAQGLAYAQQVQNPWQRAECINAIVPYMPEALLPEVIKANHRIKDASYRSYVLSALANRFPKVWPEALTTVEQIHDRYGDHRKQAKGFACRSIAICKIVEDIPWQYLEEVTEIVQQIPEASDQAMAWISLARRDSALWQEALNSALNIKEKPERVKMLIPIAQNLPKLWSEALDTAREIRDIYNRVWALIEIAQGLPEQLPELWSEVLTLSRKMKDPHSRAWAFSAIAQHEPELWTETLILTKEIKDINMQADVLGEIVRHLPDNQWPEAINIIQALDNTSEQANVLYVAIHRLPEAYWTDVLSIIQAWEEPIVRAQIMSEVALRCIPTLWPKVLDIAREIEDTYEKANMMSTLAPHILNLWPEALSRCREINKPSLRALVLRQIAKHLPEVWPEVLNTTREVEDIAIRAKVWSTMTQQLPTLLTEALEITKEIKDASSQIKVLIILAQNDSELWNEILNIVGAIEDEPAQASLLSNLGQNLPEEFWPDLLTTIQKLKNEHHKASALSNLIRYAPQAIWPEVLSITRKIRRDFSKVRVLGAMAQHSSEDLYPEILSLTQKIENESALIWALSIIMPHLPEELCNEALSIIRKIEDISDQAVLLCQIARHLSGLWPEALDSIRTIEDEFKRATALQIVAQDIPEDGWNQSLEITREIQDKSEQAAVLVIMAKKVPSLWIEALNVTAEIEAESNRASRLLSLLPYLPKSRQPEALNIAQHIRDEFNQVRVLHVIAQQLPNIWTETLSTTQKIKDESKRVQILKDFASYLPDTLWPDVLYIIKEIKDESSRATALRGIAPHLPKAHHPEAIAILHSIQDKYYRAQAIQGCLPYFDALTSTFPDFAKALDTLAYQNRSDLLELLPTLRPIIMRLGEGEETFLDVLQSVREVCKQWP